MTLKYGESEMGILCCFWPWRPNAIAPEPQKNKPSNRSPALNKAVSDILLHAIAEDYIDDDARVNLLRASRSFKQIVEKTKYWLIFQKLGRLYHSKGAVPVSLTPGQYALKEQLPAESIATFFYNPALNILITGSEIQPHISKSRLQLWHSDGKELLNGEILREFRGRLQGSIKHLTFDGSSNFIVGGDDSSIAIWLLTIRKGQLVNQFCLNEFRDIPNRSIGDRLRSLHYDDSSKITYRGTSHGFLDGVRPTDQNGELISNADGIAINWIESDFLKNRLFSLSENGELKIWRTNSKECLQVFTDVCPHSKPIYDPISNTIIAKFSDQKRLRLINGITGQFFSSHFKSSHKINSVHFDQSTGLIFISTDFADAFGKVMTTIVAWEPANQKWSELATLATVNEKSYPVKFLDFDAASNVILAAGQGVQLWNLKSGGLIKSLLEDKGEVTKIEWDKKNKKLITLMRKANESKVFIINYAT